MGKKFFYTATVMQVDKKSGEIVVGWNKPRREEYITEFEVVTIRQNTTGKPPRRYVKGEKVTVVETQSRDKKPFTLIYLIPLAALVGSLLLLVSLGVAQGIAGATSLGILGLYYLVLYKFFRRKLHRKTRTHYSLYSPPQPNSNSSKSQPAVSTQRLAHPAPPSPQ